ncbi:hypothetical protein [Streptomyces sp. NBC_01803]|uniref:hypothetical protein n=1 Tax=Streptomyces sp. NBC_01803 TaxID=2975946 RepID=UPI002DDBAE21|nr:hypothetical protein [Streptomyces sp. NBC_01803]WSA46858.1 hypothetical protein OIE51_23340 [Streptomyces sp. NBC_01803]
MPVLVQRYFPDDRAGPVTGRYATAFALGTASAAALTIPVTRAAGDRLSAFAQSVGYLLRVPGPLLVGTLDETTGGWHAPLALMVAQMVAQIAVGLRAGRNRCIEDGR